MSNSHADDTCDMNHDTWQATYIEMVAGMVAKYQVGQRIPRRFTSPRSGASPGVIQKPASGSVGRGNLALKK